jgi:type IV secretory pathway VirJ component
MKRLLFILSIFVFKAAISPAAQDSLRFGRFGDVTIYRESPHPSEVVLFVSGDGGWNLGVIGMAKRLATLDALVAGIDIIHYLKELGSSSESCTYPAADFEALSQFIQKKYDFPIYITPILVGYSSGATLVYAILVQAPFNTFKGGVSLGFCPDLPLTKPLCKGNGLEFGPGPSGKGYSFLPAKNLEVPWIALQGAIDQVCDAAATTAYVKQVSGAEIILLPKVGHGFSVERNWMPQFKQAFSRIVSEYHPAPLSAAEVQDLPLIVDTAQSGGPPDLALIVSGDGGWGVTERGIGSTLSKRGVPVVGLNSLHYFWSHRTPESMAADLKRILEHYFVTWNKQKAILVGYSLGAEALPFMINRLPEDMKSRIDLIALLGPGETTDFEFHFVDWIGSFTHKNSIPVRPELEKLKGMKILCFYGEEDKDTICPSLDTTLSKAVPISGGHRFRGNYEPVTEAILRELKAGE